MRAVWVAIIVVEAIVMVCAVACLVWVVRVGRAIERHRAERPSLVLPPYDPHMACPDGGCGPDCPARIDPPPERHHWR